MPVTNKRNRFLESETGIATATALQAISQDATYNTGTSYSTNSVLYPDNRIPFVDKHMNYLSEHPETDPQLYLANIRLKSRIR